MPNPVDFSIPAVSRQGTFQTTQLVQAGYTSLAWQLNIPNTTDYENTANSFSAKVLYDPAGGTNYIEAGGVTWQGGKVVFHGVTDPPPGLSIGLANIPAGSTMIAQVNVPLTMTIGIQNGVLS